MSQKIFKPIKQILEKTPKTVPMQQAKYRLSFSYKAYYKAASYRKAWVNMFFDDAFAMMEWADELDRKIIIDPISVYCL